MNVFTFVCCFVAFSLFAVIVRDAHTIWNEYISHYSAMRNSFCWLAAGHIGQSDASEIFIAAADHNITVDTTFLQLYHHSDASMIKGNVEWTRSLQSFPELEFMSARQTQYQYTVAKTVMHHSSQQQQYDMEHYRCMNNQYALFCSFNHLMANESLMEAISNHTCKYRGKKDLLKYLLRHRSESEETTAPHASTFIFQVFKHRTYTANVLTTLYQYLMCFLQREWS